MSLLFFKFFLNIFEGEKSRVEFSWMKEPGPETGPSGVNLSQDPDPVYIETGSATPFDMSSLDMQQIGRKF